MYNKNSNGEISAMQSFSILINMIVGTGILGLSRSVAEISQQDAWLSVLINGIFITFIVVIIVYTISKFPKYNFLQYSCYLLSKPLGYIFVFCYAIYGIALTVTVISFLSEMISTWLLFNTPSYIIKLLIVLTVVYMTKNGLTILARFNECIIFLLIPLALLIFVGLPEASLVNLKPIGGSGLSNILKGALPSFYAFAGYETLLVYYPYISNKQKPIMKYSVIAIISVTLLYTAMVMTQIALYGPDEILTVLYPSINYLTSVTTPVFERTELFFTVFWIFTVIATSGIQYLSSAILFQNIFKTKKINFFVYAFAPIIYVLSLLPQNVAVVTDLGEKMGNANIVFGFLLPILLFIMLLIKRRNHNGEKNN